MIQGWVSAQAGLGLACDLLRCRSADRGRLGGRIFCHLGCLLLPNARLTGPQLAEPPPGDGTAAAGPRQAPRAAEGAACGHSGRHRAPAQAPAVGGPQGRGHRDHVLGAGAAAVPSASTRGTGLGATQIEPGAFTSSAQRAALARAYLAAPFAGRISCSTCRGSTRKHGGGWLCTARTAPAPAAGPVRLVPSGNTPAGQLRRWCQQWCAARPVGWVSAAASCCRPGRRAAAVAPAHRPAPTAQAADTAPGPPAAAVGCPRWAQPGLGASEAGSAPRPNARQATHHQHRRGRRAGMAARSCIHA